MGTNYTHFTIEERCEVARLHAAGHSSRQIAAALDRAPSTIMREVKRNGSRKRGYERVYADEQAQARRWGGGKLERDDVLREKVLGYLQWGWSPEQVVGHMAREAGGPVISHETIYRFIYSQMARTKDYSWRHYLAARQVETGLAWAQRRQSGLLHCTAPSLGRTSPGGSRPPDARSLGG